METTIKYKIVQLASSERGERNITLVKASNDNDQQIQFIDFELPSLRLGDELEVTIKNNEQ